MTSSYLVGACTGRSAGFSPLSAINVTSGLPKLVDEIRAIRNQATGGDEVAFVVNRGQLVPCCKRNNYIAIDHCPRTSRYDQAAIGESCKQRDGTFHLVGVTDTDRVQFHPERRRHRLDSTPLASPAAILGSRMTAARFKPVISCLTVLHRLFVCHDAVMSVGYCVLQMAMRIVCRHDGHCDGATPDERAPFRVWSFHFWLG